MVGRKKLENKTCKGCGCTFKPKRHNQLYCGINCPCDTFEKRKEQSLNRPYTDETEYFIWKWYKDGDSVEKISLALGRNPKQIRETINKIIHKKGANNIERSTNTT